MSAPCSCYQGQARCAACERALAEALGRMNALMLAFRARERREAGPAGDAPGCGEPPQPPATVPLACGPAEGGAS